ncbi:UNVERIFIED_CONTAM: DUF4834 family protein [Prevotella sp. 15_C9]
MVTLFKFILFIFGVFLIAIVWIAYAFYKQIRRKVQRFKPEDWTDNHHTTKNTIIDRRSSEQRKKQVIGDDEGEYVDFTISDKKGTEKDN